VEPMDHCESMGPSECSSMLAIMARNRGPNDLHMEQHISQLHRVFKFGIANYKRSVGRFGMANSPSFLFPLPLVRNPYPIRTRIYLSDPIAPHHSHNTKCTTHKTSSALYRAWTRSDLHRRSGTRRWASRSLQNMITRGLHPT